MVREARKSWHPLHGPARPLFEMIRERGIEHFGRIIADHIGLTQSSQQHQTYATVEHFLVHAHERARARRADFRRLRWQREASQQVDCSLAVLSGDPAETRG